MPKPSVLYQCEDCRQVFESFEELVRCQIAHHQPSQPKEDSMTFPWREYQAVIEEAAGVIADRDAKGRNNVVPFFDGFPHGFTDVSFELSRRIGRILGAEKVRKLDVARADAVDLLNYAAFYVMLLDRFETSLATSLVREAPPEPATPPTPPLRSI